MIGMPCEDVSCEANLNGYCTAEEKDGCEGYVIGDEDSEEEL